MPVSLLSLVESATGSGPAWGTECEDLNMTLLTWKAGESVQAHVNEEIDVVMVVVSGSGEASVSGEMHTLKPGDVLLIPKGAERSVRSLSDKFAYLNVHKRRKKLMPGSAKRPTN